MHTGRYDAGADHYRNGILVFGGFDASGAALSSVESYDLDYNRWAVAPPMPTARGDFGIVDYGRNTSITILGGADRHGRALNTVERYDPAAKAWSRRAPMPQARRGLAAAQEAPGAPGAGDLMIAGGRGVGGRLLNGVMEYIDNIPRHGDQTWRVLAPMHTGRSDFALVVGGNVSNGTARVYAIGGFGSGHAPLRSVEAYNRRTNRWTAMAPMPMARGGPAAQATDSGRLITVAGGFDGAGHALASVEQYNVTTNRWTTMPSMPAARGGLTLVNTEGTSRPGLFALGGRGARGAVLASGSAREAALLRGWSLDTPLPQKRGAVVAVRGATGLIYVFGAPSRVDVFDPSRHAWSVRAPLPSGPGPGGSVTAVAGPQGMIYVMVGTTLEVYDPATNNWTRRAPVPVDRSASTAVTGKDGRIYLLGGSRPDPAEGDNFLYPRGLDVYDPGFNSWRVKAPMPTGREGLGAAIGPDGTVYAIGGGTYHYKAARCFSVVEAYSPGTNMWRRKTALPEPACAVTAGSTTSGTVDAVVGAALKGGDGGSMIVAATGRVLALRPGQHRWSVISRTPFPRNGAGTVVEPDGTVYVIGGADGFGDATATVQKCLRCGDAGSSG